jgi:hypothetical protein
MRLLLAVLVAVAAVVAMPAAAADRMVERGIVQSIDPGQAVLRALDGSRVTVVLGPDTRFRLNGRRAVVEEIQPGFVAEAVTVGDGPARVLRAFGRVTDRLVQGEVVRVGPALLVVRRSVGGNLRIRLTALTAAWRGDRRVRVRSLRRGMQVDVRLAPSGAARTILVLRTVG